MLSGHALQLFNRASTINEALLVCILNLCGATVEGTFHFVNTLTGQLEQVECTTGTVELSRDNMLRI